MGSNGIMKIPNILYGTAWKKERTAELVKEAVRSGFRGIDTACQPKHYNEAGVGEGWRLAAEEAGLPREAFFLQTKFTPLSGQDPESLPYDLTDSLEDQVRQSVATSLVNLRTTYLDSLILHSPMGTFEETLTVWRVFEEAMAAGHVRGRLGISNCYDLNTLKALWNGATSVKPSILQNRFYAATGFDVDLRAFCKEKGITYQTFWTLTANRNALTSPEVMALAQGRGLTPQQTMFAFVSGTLGLVPLTGTSSSDHMIQDLEVIDRVARESSSCSTASVVSPEDTSTAKRVLLDAEEVQVMSQALGIPMP
ncbi:unnamed protein product [Choristocarpus tenellus]